MPKDVFGPMSIQRSIEALADLESILSVEEYNARLARILATEETSYSEVA